MLRWRPTIAALFLRPGIDGVTFTPPRSRPMGSSTKAYPSRRLAACLLSTPPPELVLARIAVRRITVDLTLALESGTNRRMGRPPLKRNVETVVSAVRLTADMVARIDAIAGPNKRGEFIRKAVERALKANPPTLRAPTKSPDAE